MGSHSELVGQGALIANLWIEPGGGICLLSIVPLHPVEHNRMPCKTRVLVPVPVPVPDPVPVHKDSRFLYEIVIQK